MGLRRLLKRARKPAQLASGVGAQVGGALVGSAIGGLPGAAAGATVGTVTKEVLSRWLSTKQRERIVEIHNQAVARMEALLKEGRPLRNDGFFQGQEGSRSDSEEVFEGVLVAATTEHEERKLPHLAALLANIAFDPKVDRGMANYLLRLAESLSYRQLCLLALVARQDEIRLPHGRAEELPWKAWALWRELDDLGFASKELVAVRPEGIGGLPTNLGMAAELNLITGGTALYNLMNLNEIDPGELKALAAVLWEGLPKSGEDAVGDVEPGS
jgi:hypothetical protein